MIRLKGGYESSLFAALARLDTIWPSIFQASRGKSNVTLIDIRPDLIEKATNSLDVRGIMAALPPTPILLAEAGAADADLLIAVTQIDEINMIACQIAHSVFGVTTKVARVREQAYLDDRWSELFAAEHLPIDRLISPEREVAQSIERLLEVPGAFDVFPFAEGKALLCGVRCVAGAPGLGKPLSELKPLWAEHNLRCLAVRRQSQSLIAQGDLILEAEDELYFMCARDQANQALALFGHEEVEGRRVLIVGGHHWVRIGQTAGAGSCPGARQAD